MVILDSKTGKLCNRLFTASTFIAHALTHGYPLTITGFEEYYRDFEDLKNVGTRIRILSSVDSPRLIVLRFANHLARRFPWVGKMFFLRCYTGSSYLGTPDFIESANSGVLLVSGFGFWDIDSFKAHSAELRKVFRPRADFGTTAESWLTRQRSSDKVLVGVHARRGDYEQHYGGRYFYGPDVYTAAMRQMQQRIEATGRSVRFIICSNEKLPWVASLTGLDCQLSEAHAMTDLVLLSNMDYIIGPPSTFSMWASFYGEVPTLFLFSPQEEIVLERFSVVVAPNKFANGFSFTD